MILHTAAQVAVTRSIVDPRSDFESNALGTFNVLESARLNDSTVLFCSTNKVYGENVNAIRIREMGGRYVFSDPIYMKTGYPRIFQLTIPGIAHMVRRNSQPIRTFKTMLTRTD